MAATVLDGNKIASQIRAEVAAEVTALASAGMRPGIAVILVGHNSASEIYVRRGRPLQRKTHAFGVCDN